MPTNGRGATWRILEGDCRDRLRELPAGSVQTCVTSPPYYGLRDYGTPGQLGLEPTPDEYVANLVAVFREVRRVLRDDGTVWLNLGDSYHGGGYSNHQINGEEWLHAHGGDRRRTRQQDRINANPDLKPKDLVGIPWMVAFALRADGWTLRSDIIWNKPNPMPESVTDRPTKSHEYVFLLSKGPRYFYDIDAIREDGTSFGRQRSLRTDKIERAAEGIDRTWQGPPEDRYDIPGRNKRSVWTVATQPYPGAHFATFPPKLIEPCILAGSPERACGECGAPWERIVDTTATGPGIECPQDREGWEARWAPRGGVNEASVAASRLHGQYHDVQRRTVGWAPSCTHQDGTDSSVVLDLFAGSGTTGLVALRHNRSFVGCELSPEYVQLARWRIVDDAPLLNSVAEAHANAR